MNENRWPSSHLFQNVLHLLGCEVLQDTKVEMLNIYNPKTKAVVTIPSQGHLQPELVTNILRRLGLWEELRDTFNANQDSKQ